MQNSWSRLARPNNVRANTLSAVCLSGVLLLCEATSLASTPLQNAPLRSPSAAATTPSAPLRLNFPTQKISATINAGQVTLEGQWSSFEERRLLLEALAKIGGIAEIFDHGVIKPQTRSDEEIQNAVLAAIHNDSGLSDTSIKVQVEKGTVNLSGTAFNWLEKDIVTWVAGKVPGVVDVNDRIKTEYLYRPDSDIVRSIKDQFAVDLTGENSANIQVNVTSGVVILSGTTPNLKSKQDAVRIAEAATGVKEVSNEITVQPAPTPETKIAARIREQLGGRPSHSALSDAPNTAQSSRAEN